MSDEARTNYIVVDNFEGNTRLYTDATMEEVCEMICRKAGIKSLDDAKECAEAWLGGEEVRPFENWQAVYDLFQENPDVGSDHNLFEGDAIVCAHIEDATPMSIQEILKIQRDSQS